MNQYLAGTDIAIDAIDESSRSLLISTNGERIKKVLRRPKEQLKDETMLAIANSVDMCLRDIDYIIELKSANSMEYKILNTYPKAILRGIDVLFSAKKEIREKALSRFMKHTDLDTMDFKIVHHAFSRFAQDRGYRSQKEMRDFVKEMRRDLHHLLEFEDVYEELDEIRDFFVHLHKYRTSHSYRLSCM
ncbi:hypothetical protein GF358_02485 [Candidatus Woesearchaeota archaeon]|nr:hypothetical protein [Candidatus Woesearchaeota archaeon]